MTLRCRNCSRVNPPEAHYCYFDGAVLDGHGAGSGPVAVGQQPFLSPFVFPSGRQCRNFDELVLACYGEWKEAQAMLQQGYLESFFGALGRTDLAQAARQGARAADPDRGLDQLLAKLPASTREPARLFAQPLEINLGQLARDTERRFVLHVENQGMGLLYGSVACDKATDWLVLGEGASSPRKVFQCLHEFTLTVQVHGKSLRAGNKSLEGRLTIDTNGGTCVVVVRADVPVRPFPDGVLAGAVSPRQVAEKAKANPKGAAPLFERGAVAAWYESNGWTYPVQGPASSGLGAIQQFFEALGLVKAPAVEISQRSVELQGPPGATLEHVLQVQAQERRPVFAHATTGAPWLQIGRIVLDGRTARIPLKVPAVPARPGERLEGKVQVTSNGNQRFLVDVSLTITGRMAVRVDRLPARAVLDMNQVLAAVPVATARALPAGEAIADALPVAGTGLPPVRAAAVLDVLPVAEVYGTPRSRIEDRGSRIEDREGAILDPRSSILERRGGFARHLLPLAAIVLLLLIVVGHDLWLIVSEPAGPDGEALVDPNPYIAIRFHDGPVHDEGDKALPDPTMRFGLVMLREKDPEHPDRLKKLTFDEWGRSNNTCLRADGDEYIFGQAPGQWIEMKEKLGKDKQGRERDGLASSWWLPQDNRAGTLKIKVVQEVELVPGEQSRRLDTCLVRYVLENRDSRAHRVSIRFLLDTFIGANDGVPFTIPGRSSLCDSKMAFNTPEQVPDFIQALENNDPLRPGTVAYLQFRVGKQVESPSRVTLGGWPNPDLKKLDPAAWARQGLPEPRAQLTGWEVPFISMHDLDQLAWRHKRIHAPYDSAVTMYWSEQPLEPGHTRTVGFTYGLGDVHAGESEGRLLLSVGGRLVRNGEFTLTALVHNPQPGERLTLALPPGFALTEGDPEQDVPAVPLGAPRPDSTVTWRIRAGNDGAYELLVRSSKGAQQKLPIRIRTRGLYD